MQRVFIVVLLDHRKLAFISKTENEGKRIRQVSGLRCQDSSRGFIADVFPET
jgi:hypothetical protein